MRHLHDVGGEACLSVGLLLGGRSVELLQVGVAGLLGHRLPEVRGEARQGAALQLHHHQQHQLVTHHSIGLWSLK